MASLTIVKALELILGTVLTKKWFDEYRSIKKDFLKEDWPNCIIHCGLFSELTMAVLKVIYDKKSVDLNKIQFDNWYNDFISRPKPNAKDEILLLALPYAAKTVYTLRNKKKGAHIKAIDPDFIDCLMTISLCDYILAQVILLKCNINQKELKKFISTIVGKKVPLIEEFDDGSLVIHLKNASFPDELLLGLYKINERISKQELRKKIKVEYPQKLDSSLRSLEKRKLIHINESGFQITSEGIRKIENLLESLSK